MIVIQMQHAQIRLVHIIALANLDSVEMAKSIVQVRVVFCSVAFSVVIFFIQFKCIENGFIYSSRHECSKFPLLFSTDDSICASLGDCHANATCINDNGNYSCRCNTGYTGNGTNCEGSLLSSLKIEITLHCE